MSRTIEIPAPRLPPLYPKQRDAILCPARYTIIEATTKAGKTAGCLIWILSEAWNKGHENRNWWWVAPVIEQSEVAFRRLHRMMRQFDPAGVSWSANLTRRTIALRNGATIWFKGADSPDTLFGEDVYGAVVDEATRCKEEAWHAVRSTLTATQGSVKIIGNVRGRKNWAYRMAQRAKAGQLPNAAYFKLTAFDAVEGGIMATAEVEDARRTLPERVFKELYLAEPSDDGGNPFGLDALARCKRPGLSGRPVACYGVDLAKSVDWTVVCGLDEIGDVASLERWQGDWGATRRKLTQVIGATPALVDSTGVGDPVVEDLCRELPSVEGFKFTQQSKQQIMEGLAASVQQDETGIPQGWLMDECESFEFEYRPGGMVRYAAPQGMTDDGVCALALARHKLRSLMGGMFEMAGEDIQSI